MVGTRSARKGPRPQNVIEADDAGRQDSDSSGSDGDDAPEEVALNTGKEAAARQRRTEREAKTKAAAAVKERRKRQRPAEPSSRPTEAAAAGSGEPEGDDVEELQLDLLPDEVIEAMAEAEGSDRRLAERRIVTEELRAAAAQPAWRKQRRKLSERKAGPVTVQVLSTVGDRRASEAAKAFMAERLHGGGVRRSLEMLQPTKIGGMFIHGPKLS